MQRRFDGQLSFQQSYLNYTEGFGDPEGEFWMGEFDKSATWCSGLRHCCRCERSGFDYQAGQIRQSVATAATFLRSCVAKALSRWIPHSFHVSPTRMVSPTRFMLRCNSVSIMRV